MGSQHEGPGGSCSTYCSCWSTAHPPIGPHDENCHCGVFITLEEAEDEIFHYHPLEDLEDCDLVEQCMADCSEEWLMQSSNGDLTYVLANGNTLGEELCVGANDLGHPLVEHAIPLVYSRMCEGGWAPTGDQGNDYLCCDGGHQIPCP